MIWLSLRSLQWSNIAVHPGSREEELRKQFPQCFKFADLISCNFGGRFGVVRLEEMGCRPAPGMCMPAVESGIVCLKEAPFSFEERERGKSDVDLRVTSSIEIKNGEIYQ